ncbi:secretin N-terminal domain-containing protein [Marivita sp. S0852]|uniref:secretin N-terminal domain-containing protein n=1 Tax=Marivita sp. S0852 TaxID=3373893 RepID=UPI0039824808
MAALLFAVLSGCAAGDGKAHGAGDAPPPLVVATDPVTGQEIITTSKEAYGDPGFFSEAFQRETVFSGNTSARLTNTADAGQTGFVDTGDINAGPDVARGPDGNFFSEINQASPIIRPLESARIQGAAWQPRYASTPSVTLNYDGEELTQVIQNILGGILGQNFIIGESVQGRVTFKSNTRFTRAQLVQVLADILARNGYAMQYLNGVYQVGLPEELERLAQTRSRSGLGGDELTTIPIERGDPEAIASLLTALAPPSVQVASVPDTNKIVLRGDSTQFASVEDLVRTLIDTGVARQEVAILPLRQNDPTVVAEELNALYADRGISGVTIIPLSTRQGLLVAANTDAALDEVRRLARGLDVDRRDSVSLRVIQLTHGRATEVAEQIASVFGAGITSPRDTTEAANESAILAVAAERGSSSAAEATGIRAPSTFRGQDDAPAAAPAATQSRAAGDPTLPSGEGLSVVADPRNNAVLIRSTYKEFQRIRKVVKALDIPLAQVVIEATIVEVDISDELSYGVQTFLDGAGFSIRSSRGGTSASDPGGQGLAAIIRDTTGGGTDIQAVITALQSVTNVRVISSPYVTVVDGATSRLSVGDQIPFVTASQSSSSDGNVVVTQEIETVDVGVILDVTPTIRPDNSVLLDIAQTVSAARRENTAAGENPVISQRSVNSQVNVDSGFTVLLGGLISERTDTSEGGVPVLRKVPLLGGLFNQKSNLQSRSELLIMITPRVVRNSHGLSGLTEQIRWATSTD